MFRVKIAKPGHPYRWFTDLDNENGTETPKLTNVAAEAREFVKREDAESIVGFLRSKVSENWNFRIIGPEG